MLVVDSVAALVPKAEIEGEMGDSHMGLQARLMSQALRKLTGIMSKSNCCVIFINQIRMKIGVMFGNPETTTGGNALKFYASVRMDIRKIASLKQGNDVIGSPHQGKGGEEQGGSSLQGGGIRYPVRRRDSREGDLLDLAVEKGSSTRAAPGFPMKRNGSARAGRIPGFSSKSIRRRPRRFSRDFWPSSVLPGRKLP